MKPESSKKLMFDFCVIGGGIVGLATALRVSQHFPDAKIVVVEKENGPGEHQSGRNSGVLHSGVYYKPGSIKAITCRRGKEQMEHFCDEHEIPFERCGKVIVATQDEEIPRLEKIYERGIANGVDCQRIDQQQLKDLEPSVRGVAAIHVRETGIVDYLRVCRKIVDVLRANGHAVQFGWKVDAINATTDKVQLFAANQTFEARFVVNCAGLYSDRIMRLAGEQPPAKIVPFRGEYYELISDAEHFCRNLIYPVPDPAFPFLGVHFTRMVNGGVECGPNAVLALAREGYDWGTICFSELWDSLAYSGFQKMAIRHWRMGLAEIQRSLSKSAFLKALQCLIPKLRAEQLRRCRAGVRAQAVKPDGSMVDDFLIVAKQRIVHVCNAPSPAATASLEIGNHICESIDAHLYEHHVRI
jgi:L-2-hydroxyglutarate oxidase